MTKQKILIVGFGSIGQRHYKNLLKKKKYDIIICSKRKDIIKNLSKQTTIKKTIKECLIEKPQIALITNETSKHVLTALKLAKKNIDIFIEKPLSHSLKDISELEYIIKKNKIICYTGYQFRHHPCVKKIKDVIEKQILGKIILIKAENGSFFPDWHKNEDYTKNYVSLKKLGGGVLLTNIHELDYLTWIFGSVKECFAVVGKFSDLKIETDDLASIILKFKNNTIAEVHLDIFQINKTRSCRIIGTKGILDWNILTNTIKIYKKKEKKWKTIMKLKKFDYNEPYRKEVDEFLKNVESRKIDYSNLNESINVLNLAVDILKSSKSKRMIKINKKN